ncbi:MAG: hypothetical protein PHW47_06195 [Lachnospira sp.]|nr:hypothetical protein [Lachnospira sp.]
MKSKTKKIITMIFAVSALCSLMIIPALADWSTSGFSFSFDGMSGDVYSYSSPQSKDNASSSYIYYESGNADIEMCIVGYNGGIVEDITLPKKTFWPGRSDSITNWVNENGLDRACLRGEATIDSWYSGSGNWSADTY